MKKPSNKITFQNKSEMMHELRAVMYLYVFLLHDYLLTPVTHIMGFSRLLQEKKIVNNPKKKDEYLKIIFFESDRLYKNVDKIFSFLKKWNLESVSDMDIEDALMIVEKDTAEYLRKMCSR